MYLIAPHEKSLSCRITQKWCLLFFLCVFFGKVPQQTQVNLEGKNDVGFIRYTPFSDRQQLGALRTLNCAGTVWIPRKGLTNLGELL